ncbi:MAG: hypothetical protein F6K11_29935, partial [Leptolyngbya sp. SIO3F4]|nr:hypothetical protein [Leptolyngbya sp. SIO3F4]
MVILITLLPSISKAQEEVRKIEFTKADSVAALYPSHSIKNLFGLVNKLCSPFDNEVEKFRAIYTWVCLNIENDYQLFLKNQNKRKKLINKPAELAQWNKGFSKKVFETLLEKQKTVCTGYAYLIKEMAGYVGIQAEIVDGYGRTTNANIKGEGRPNHSWNAVQLNGKWYLCDATWSSGNIVTDGKETKFNKFYDPGYFLADPELFVWNHFPLDTTWLLMDNPPTLQEFLNRPIIYRGAFTHQIRPLFPEKLALAVTKGESVKFCFKN